MQIADIKTRYPKSYKKFLDYNRKYLIALTNTALPEGEKIDDSISQLLTDSSVEQAAEGLLTYYPRALYDFLDENELYANVRSGKKWSYQVDGKAVVAGNTNFDSRIAAEEAAFNEAFDLLEAHL